MLYQRLCLFLFASLPMIVQVRAGNLDSGVAESAASAPNITSQPMNETGTIGAQATFPVAAAGTAPLTYQWHKRGAVIAAATNASYTMPAVSSTDNGATLVVTVRNRSGSVSSAPTILAVAAPAPGTDVVTYKNDLARTGQNLTEPILTPTNVAAATFGLLRQLPVDGKVDAQPLYLSALFVNGRFHNTVFAATEHDSVYAFEADSGATLWHVSLLGSGETPSDMLGCSQVEPEIGITATPVIDRTAGVHGVIYVVAMSKDAASNYHQRLHALDVTTGTELLHGPTTIAATYPTTHGVATKFDPRQYEERAALLLTGKTIYTTWTSHCDVKPYTGWIIAFNQSTLARSAILNVGANGGGAGPGIWMGGGGPAADATGNIYLLTGNGPFFTSVAGS